VGTREPIKTLRVVIDTNVVVSALLFAGGRLNWLRQAWQQGVVVPVVSQATAKELLRVLAYPKFGLTNREQQDVLAEYLPFCEVAAVPAPVAVPELRDGADAIFVQLAISAGVNCLVTGDVDLLSLRGDFAFSVLKPHQLRLRVEALF
jgi:putative PIN family toxin of toxin-antitoxin system